MILFEDLQHTQKSVLGSYTYRACIQSKLSGVPRRTPLGVISWQQIPHLTFQYTKQPRYCRSNLGVSQNFKWTYLGPVDRYNSTPKNLLVLSGFCHCRIQVQGQCWVQNKRQSISLGSKSKKIALGPCVSEGKNCLDFLVSHRKTPLSQKLLSILVKCWCKSL